MAATPPGEPEAFADLRPLPAGAFANSTELFEAEGATYFWCAPGGSTAAPSPCRVAGRRRAAGSPLVQPAGCLREGGHEGWHCQRPPSREMCRRAVRCHAFPAPCTARRLYRLVQNLEAHLGCFLRDGTAFQPPPGWDLVSMLSITEPVSPATAAAATAGSDAGSTDSSAGGSAGGGSGGGAAGGSVALPFAAVLLQRAAGQLVVAVRGTMTGPEWLLDFSYK